MHQRSFKFNHILQKQLIPPGWGKRKHNASGISTGNQLSRLVVVTVTQTLLDQDGGENHGVGYSLLRGLLSGNSVNIIGLLSINRMF
jgi:hypothetical protein